MNGCASDFELVTKDSLSEVLALLASGWRPMAGGTDLMVLFEAGRQPFRKLVSVTQLEDLRRIEVAENHISVGAAVTYAEIRGHQLLQREFPLLCRAASWTGGIANQNRGTLGGNIVNASPAADSLPALLVYEAELELMSVRGARRISYEVFHMGYKSMAMQPDELLVSIRLPRSRVPWISYARKVGARKAQAIAKAGMAALARMDGDRIGEVRIAVASVAPVPLRCRATERAVMTSRSAALHALDSEIAPIDDVRSTGEYRRKVTVNLLGEFLDSLEPLARWNQLPEDEAEAALLRCCGSTRWAAELAAMRPLHHRERVFEAADQIWRGLSEPDWLEAFGAHPRIGDSASDEQAGMHEAGAEMRTAMAAGNREYEQRFGFIYIVRASGKSAQRLLAILQSRLHRSRQEELAEAAEQQRQITQLRLRKWLGE